MYWRESGKNVAYDIWAAIASTIVALKEISTLSSSLTVSNVLWHTVIVNPIQVELYLALQHQIQMNLKREQLRFALWSVQLPLCKS